MITTRIAGEERQAGASIDYITNADAAAPGDEIGTKACSFGILNAVSEDLAGAKAEMIAAQDSYDGGGDAIGHWITSWREGERPTPSQVDEYWQSFLKDQGLEGHMLIHVEHDNTANFHSHAVVCRVTPEPDENGKYLIQNEGGREKWANGATNQYESARATTIDFCEKYGFEPDFGTVEATQKDKDGIKLTQSQRAWSAQHQQPHPVELFGLTARDELRASENLGDAVQRLNKHGLSFQLINNKDGSLKGGVIKGPQDEKLFLSALPKDCSAKNLLARWNGETGNVKDAPKKGAGAKFYEGKLSANQAKFQARQAFNTAGTFAEAEMLLGEKGMRIERQGKSGAYLVYTGKSGAEEKMKLSALGGKYSLHALSKKYADPDHILSLNHASSIPGINASVKKDATQSASERAERAESYVNRTAERAASVAAEAPQAKTLSEAIDDGIAQAQALDALRRAKLIAAEAEKRADAAEQRARNLEEAQSTKHSQPHATNEKDKKMYDNEQAMIDARTIREVKAQHMRDAKAARSFAEAAERGDYETATQRIGAMHDTAAYEHFRGPAVKFDESNRPALAEAGRAASAYADALDAAEYQVIEYHDNDGKLERGILVHGDVTECHVNLQHALHAGKEETGSTIDETAHSEIPAAGETAPVQETALKIENPVESAQENEAATEVKKSRKFGFSALKKQASKFGLGGSKPGIGPRLQ